MRKVCWLFVLSLVLSGCATKLPMGVDSTTESLDLKGQSLLLLTVDISRQEPSRFKPLPHLLQLATVDASGVTGNGYAAFLDGDSEISIDEAKKIHVYRFLAPEGQIGISGIYGYARAFPMNGTFHVPLRMQVPVDKSSVIYLGRVEAILRPRAEDEYRAGEVIPLIDQAVTGMSTGTFDVQLKDQSAVDVPLLRSTFPALASEKIVTRLVPIVDREYLDRSWQGQDMSGVDPYKNSRKAGQAEPPSRK